MTKERKKLQSTLTFDKDIAKSFSKTRYYKAQARNMAMYEYIESEKERLKTPRSEELTRILDFYKNLGESGEWTSTCGSILQGIYRKNCDSAKLGKKAINSNLLQIVSNPETLLLAYRAIKSNKGALAKGSDISTEKINKMTQDQLDFYFKTKIFPDGFSLEDMYLASRLLSKGRFVWGSSRRIWLPKPGIKDKKRPITIPPFIDRVIQKAIAMVLEAIYEPYFEIRNRSFGFRPNKGTHDAIIAATSNYSSGKITAIEGDIEAAYDTVNKETLLSILGERITDRKFLQLIRQRLDYDYVETTPDGDIRHKPKLGIPQGGIDSPYLYNIYMNKLDEFVHTEVQNYLDTLNANKNATKRKLSKTFTKTTWSLTKNLKEQSAIKSQLRQANQSDSLKVNSLKKELFKKIKERKLIIHKKLDIKSSDQSNKELKLLYVRYADDWILLTNGNKLIATKIKQMISSFLEEKLGLRLSDKKTVITDIRKEPAKFLGFQLRHPARGPIVKKLIISTGSYKKWNLQRKAGTIIWAAPDTQRLINRFHMKGFCDENGKPKELAWLSCLETHVIIERYNAVIRGFAEFYFGFIRNNSDIQRWINVLRYSCLKTLAQKYRTSISGIFARFGFKLTSKSYKTIQFKARLKVKGENYEKTWTLFTYKQLLRVVNYRSRLRERKDKFWTIENKQQLGEYKLRAGGIPAITNADYLDRITWVSLRTQATFDIPCPFCNSTEKIQSHHLKGIRLNAYELISKDLPWKQVMALRTSLQLPVCSKCHRERIHTGEYDGPKLRSFVPNRLMDNRVLNIHAYVKPGIEYHAKSLEEKGWKSIQKERLGTPSTEQAS